MRYAWKPPALPAGDVENAPLNGRDIGFRRPWGHNSAYFVVLVCTFVAFIRRSRAQFLWHMFFMPASAAVRAAAYSGSW